MTLKECCWKKFLAITIIMYNRVNEVKHFLTLIDEIQVTGSSIPDKEPNLSLLGPVKPLVVLPDPLIQSN